MRLPFPEVVRLVSVFLAGGFFTATGFLWHRDRGNAGTPSSNPPRAWKPWVNIPPETLRTEIPLTLPEAYLLRRVEAIELRHLREDEAEAWRMHEHFTGKGKRRDLVASGFSAEQIESIQAWRHDPPEAFRRAYGLRAR